MGLPKDASCKTCRWWSVDYNIHNDMSDCDNSKSGNYGANAIRLQVNADDDSGLNVAVFTGKDFVCGNFEVKK